MKKIFYYILMGAFLLGTATSCEDSVEDLSKVTYFAELNLKGDDFVKLSLGETYTEPGYEATENGEDINKVSSIFIFCNQDGGACIVTSSSL